MNLILFVFLLMLGALAILVRLVYVIKTILKDRKRRRTAILSTEGAKSVKTLVVMGSGGHTKEMIQLLQTLDTRYHPRGYVFAETDKLSSVKVRALEKSHYLTDKDSYNNFKEYVIPRSREVNQSWITTVFTTLKALVSSLKIYLKSRPDLLLVNGPGTCVPLCIIAFINKLLFRHDSVKIVFVESICRVQTLSLSGKLLYFLVDEFFVQWPELAAKYPHTRYVGRFL